jgi:hypothetical protein
MLYGLCVDQEAMCVDEVFVDELRSKEKGGCARDPL